MTNEEIEAVAYKDFLEIRGKVQIAMDRFVRRVRCTGPGRWCLHSLQETHTIQTRTKNTWTVYFHYLHTTPTGVVIVSSMVYILLPRNKGTDYLFMNNLDRFRLEKLSSHFLRRYKERYIDLNQIELGGLHPAIYFMRTNGDRRPAFYTPNTWTEEERKDKYILVSNQGLIVVTMKGRIETSITFMDQEHLSDYRAKVHEEEMLLRKFEEAANMKDDAQRALFRKLYKDRDVVLPMMTRFIRRRADSDEHYKVLYNEFNHLWQYVVDAAEGEADVPLLKATW